MQIPINYVKLTVKVKASGKKGSVSKYYETNCNIVYKKIEEDINLDDMALSRVRKALKLKSTTIMKIIKVDIIHVMGEGIDEK